MAVSVGLEGLSSQNTERERVILFVILLNKKLHTYGVDKFECVLFFFYADPIIGNIFTFELLTNDKQFLFIWFPPALFTFFLNLKKNINFLNIYLC